MKSSRDIIAKADLAVANLIADGGYLNAEQADKFIDIVIDQPTLIQTVRTVKMNSPKRKIEKIGFGNRILRAAPASGTALSDNQRARPDLGMIELETKEIIAEVWIPYDVLEDNIERGGLEDTIMTKIAQRTSLDLEELIILGDEASTDSYLALTDGVIELTPTANVVDASSITSVSKTLFKAGIQYMPTKYLRNVSMMKFYTSHHVETEYRDSLADRETILGDSKITGRNPCFAYGVPLAPCALMPNNKVVFTYPDNIIWGIQRNIMIETDKDIRRRVLIIVLTIRCDVKLEQPDACVVVESFSDAGLPTTSTTV
jgi:HK97 family phage major capsid protein